MIIKSNKQNERNKFTDFSSLFFTFPFFSLLSLTLTLLFLWFYQETNANEHKKVKTDLGFWWVLWERVEDGSVAS